MRDNGSPAYQFEGRMSGYYSDPVDGNEMARRQARSSMTHTNMQTFFAPESSKIVKAILGVTNYAPSIVIFLSMGNMRLRSQGYVLNQ
jgi:hypothetical protein